MSDNGVSSTGDSVDTTKSFDYSKTWWVVSLDIMFKGLSAIGLVALGAMSLQFQMNNGDLQKKDNARELSEQAYLPVFRGSAEVDLALGEISAQFGRAQHTKEEANRESVLGTRLAFLADSLYFPSVDGKQQGSKVQLITAPDNAYGADDPTIIDLDTEDAVRLLAVLMSLEPEFREKGAQHLWVNVEGARESLVFWTKDGKEVDELPLEHRLVAPFDMWLSERMPAADVYRKVDIDTLADELRRQLTVNTKSIISKGPTLADKYLIIRNDVIHSRQELFPTSK